MKSLINELWGEWLLSQLHDYPCNSRQWGTKNSWIIGLRLRVLRRQSLNQIKDPKFALTDLNNTDWLSSSKSKQADSILIHLGSDVGIFETFHGRWCSLRLFKNPPRWQLGYTMHICVEIGIAHRVALHRSSVRDLSYTDGLHISTTNSWWERSMSCVIYPLICKLFSLMTLPQTWLTFAVMGFEHLTANFIHLPSQVGQLI